MTLTLVLGLHGGAGALLLDGSSAPLEGFLGPADPLPDRSPPLFGLEPPPGVIAPGADARASREERELATDMERGLLRAPGMARIWDRLVRSRGAAEEAQAPFVVAIDARTDELRRLPWEVLGALRPGESPLAGVQIVRLVASDVARPLPAGERRRVEIRGWLPQEDAPTCAWVRGQLDASVAKLEQVSLRWIDPLQEGPADDDNALRVLHVVCHGEAHLDQVVLRAFSDASASTDSAARLLASLLYSAHIVVLDVCGGAFSGVASLDSPAGRFAAAGVPACVAPLLPWSSEASAVFSAGFYRSLARGGSLVQAVAHGRRGLSTQLAVAHPHARWWNPAVLVSGADSRLVAPLVRSAAWFPGWAQGGPETEDVLRRALDRGTELGFVGVEHLVIALSEHRGATFSGSALRPLAERMQALLDTLEPGPAPPLAPTLTERLRRLAPLLAEGWTLLHLVGIVLTTPTLGLIVGFAAVQRAAQACARGPTDETIVSQASGAASMRGVAGEVSRAEETKEFPPSALILEGLGGPDDGRRLALDRPGQVLGRADPRHPEAWETSLYRPPGPLSQRISRTHLHYEGAGALRAGRRTAVSRGAQSDPLPTDRGVVVRRGDVIVLRDVARLLVVREP